MPETKLERLLNTVGLKTFVDYYELFKDTSLPAKEIVALLPQEFTLKSRRARTSKARRIFQEGREAKALRLIASSKVKPSAAQQARKLLIQLEKTKASRLALFVSYDEKKHGPFQAAVDVCTSREYIVWTQNAKVDTRRILLPTAILIKIKGRNRYYQGTLRDVKRVEELDRDFLLSETDHRPVTWQQLDKLDLAEIKSVLYIEGLKQVPRPAGISKNRAPQRPHYVQGLDNRSKSQEDVSREAKHLEDRGEFDIDNIRDARKWVLTSIARRQGRPAFRATLLRRYGGCCAISGSRVEAVLEAAHIFPYKGLKTNHPKNGILLRSDLHTLFDLRLIAVDTTTMTVLVSPELKGSSYERFAGKKLKLPQEDAWRPSAEALNAHRKESGL